MKSHRLNFIQRRITKTCAKRVISQRFKRSRRIWFQNVDEFNFGVLTMSSSQKTSGKHRTLLTLRIIQRLVNGVTSFSCARNNLKLMKKRQFINHINSPAAIVAASPPPTPQKKVPYCAHKSNSHDS